jgi:DNA polymerase V
MLLMTKATVEVVDRVFRPRVKYSKAEVLLLNLCQNASTPMTFFHLATGRY